MRQPWSCIRAYCWARSFGTLWKKKNKYQPRQKQSRQHGSIEIHFTGSDFKTSFLPERRRGSRLNRVTAFICLCGSLEGLKLDWLSLSASLTGLYQSESAAKWHQQNNTGLIPPSSSILHPRPSVAATTSGKQENMTATKTKQKMATTVDKPTARRRRRRVKRRKESKKKRQGRF